MGRKDKITALYELLYKDKGKTTAPDGSLKLPGWFHGPGPAEDPEEAEQPPSAPPPPQPSEGPPPEPAEADATPVAGKSRKPAAGPAAPPRKARPAPADRVPARPPLDQSRLPDAPPRPAPSAADALGGGPRAIRPSWAKGPWLQFGGGRIRLELTNFASMVVVAVAVCVLLGSFILGIYSAPEPPAPETGQPGVDSVKKGLKLKPEAGIVKPAGGRGASNGGGRADDPDAMVAGMSYVIFQSFGDQRQAALDVAKYLNGKGFDVVVREGDEYLVRTREGVDYDRAVALADELAAVMPDLHRALPGRIRFNPSDPKLRPRVVTIRP